MKKIVIAIDMDDVLMTPHSYITFSEYLGIYEEFHKVLKEYKYGQLNYRDLFKSWNKTLSKFTTEQKQSAIRTVVATIPKDTFEFIEKIKKLGEIIIVSNNDNDLVGAISSELNTDYLAVNKFIFELKVVTNKKSKVLLDYNIKPDVAITDDPINENDFLNIAKYGIIMKRKDFVIDSPQKTTEHYLIVDSLKEIYDNLVLINKELDK